MRRFAIGDIHGAYRALEQCIKKSGIDKDNDLLISLGDVADSYPEVPECFNKLLEFKNLIYIMGNHDYWMLHFIANPHRPECDIWTSQGGWATVNAYIDREEELKEHLALLRKAKSYHLTEDNKLFTHGGYVYQCKDVLKDTTADEFMWDRGLLTDALSGTDKETLKLNLFDEAYVGHTQTHAMKGSIVIPSNEPIHIHNLWDIDTGAGWNGVLTIMDIDTKEIFQSGNVRELYPNERGR